MSGYPRMIWWLVSVNDEGASVESDRREQDHGSRLLFENQLFLFGSRTYSFTTTAPSSPAEAGAPAECLKTDVQVVEAMSRPGERKIFVLRALRSVQGLNFLEPCD
jgi:hypothetical protein